MRRYGLLLTAAALLAVFAIGTAGAAEDDVADHPDGPGVTPLDIVQNDDVIVEGNVCASDNDLCADGESFFIGPATGVEFLALDNVPRIGLVDTDADQDDWILETLGSPERFQLRSWDGSSFNTPFAVESRSGDNLLYLDDSYRIGIGTQVPDAQLEVFSSTGAARVIVEDDALPAQKRIQLWLQNEGQPAFRLTNNAATVGWEVGLNASNQFQINEVGSPSRFLVRTSGGLTARNASGQDVFVVNPNGNMTIAGALTQNSDRAAKHAIEPVDGTQVLDLVRDLEISEWSYLFEDARHVGPMAQDFYAAFGLGHSETGLSTIDTSGIALAAIQELADRNQTLEARLAELEAAAGGSGGPAIGWSILLGSGLFGAVAGSRVRRNRAGAPS